MFEKSIFLEPYLYSRFKVYLNKKFRFSENPDVSFLTVNG